MYPIHRTKKKLSTDNPTINFNTNRKRDMDGSRAKNKRKFPSMLYLRIGVLKHENAGQLRIEMEKISGPMRMKWGEMNENGWFKFKFKLAIDFIIIILPIPDISNTQSSYNRIFNFIPLPAIPSHLRLFCIPGV